MDPVTIESGTSSTAIGPGAIRTESWDTKLYPGAKEATDVNSGTGTYGYNNSSRLQYTLIFCGDTPYLLCTGEVRTMRNIDLNCCT